MIIENGNRLSTVTETGIYGFFGQFRWLSNFHVCKVTVEGIEYDSSEAAYMAQKVEDVPTRLQIAKMTPAAAKKFGRSIELRENWDYLRGPSMFACVLSKFKDPTLQEMLLMTEGYYLEETNNWGDRFWGVEDGVGLNMLGHTLMLVRDYYKGCKK